MAASANGFVTVKEHIKNKTVSKAYLFYGEEIYLKNMYIPKIKNLGYDGTFSDFNDIKITADTTLDEIDAFWESYPMMSDKKFIYVKDSGIFSGSKKDAQSSDKAAFWVKKLNDIPEYIFIIFDEKEVDARSAAYKAIVKNGTALKFDYWDEYETLAWVQRTFAKAEKKIDKSTAQYFVSICSKGLNEIKNETDKLISFCGGEVLKSDIDRVVTKSQDTQVFAITDNIIAGDIKSAISILSDFRAQNMKPVEIFFLIFNTFDKMLRTLLMLKNSFGYEAVAAKMFPQKAPSKMTFLIRKYEKSAKSLGESFLTRQIINGADINLTIRSGDIDEWTALEQYIAECIHSVK